MNVSKAFLDPPPTIQIRRGPLSHEISPTRNVCDDPSVISFILVLLAGNIVPLLASPPALPHGVVLLLALSTNIVYVFVGYGSVGTGWEHLAFAPMIPW